MIQPTVGRVVWYWPTGPSPVEQPWPALIAHVWDDRCINIGGFDNYGNPFARMSVQLLQDDDAPHVPQGQCCSWMPYQKGQAAKTEALEKKIGGEEAPTREP